MVSPAMAGVINPVTVRMANRHIPAPTLPLLFQRSGDLLSVLFVTLKYLQTSLEKVLQLNWTPFVGPWIAEVKV